MNKSRYMSRDYTLPIEPFLETMGGWEAVRDAEPDPSFSFKLHLVQVTSQEGGSVTKERELLRQGAFDMRERFFAIQNAESSLAFFQEFGPYQLSRHLDNEAKPIKLSQVLRMRDFYSHALTKRSIEHIAKGDHAESVREGIEDLYLWQNLQIELPFRQPMTAIVRCKDVEDALRATVFLDRLRGFPWQRCAREDCGKAFEVSGRRARLYCSPECAHLQSVRSYNSRKFAAKIAKTMKRNQRKGKG